MIIWWYKVYSSSNVRVGIAHFFPDSTDKGGSLIQNVFLHVSFHIVKISPLLIILVFNPLLFQTINLLHHDPY